MIALKTNAINRTASVGASPPHGPLKTGELPHVHLKAPAAGPQINNGQQKPLTILPPKDAESAVKTGGLPMVKVRMHDGKAKVDDGRGDDKVIVRDLKPAHSAGQLPMIQVKMDGGKPQIQTLPTVGAAGPQLPSAPPVLSAPRIARAGYVAAPILSQGYRASLPTAGQVRVARIAAPVVSVPLPPMPEFTPDQLMLSLHLAESYLAGLLAAETPTEAPVEGEGATDEGVVSEAVLLAQATIAAINDTLVASVVRAEAALQAAQVVEVPPTIAASASVSIAPAPNVVRAAAPANRSYTMPRARAQRNASMAPRATNREPLPMVQVKMDGQRPTVQNAAEIAAAKAAMAAAAEQPTQPSDLPSDITVDATQE